MSRVLIVFITNSTCFIMNLIINSGSYRIFLKNNNTGKSESTLITLNILLMYNS